MPRIDFLMSPLSTPWSWKSCRVVTRSVPLAQRRLMSSWAM